MIKFLLTGLVKFYRKYVTHILRSECIFTPTCSAYALDALKKRNVFIAVLLIVWRILRCNRLNKGGFDPVPDSKDTLKWVL